MSGDENVFDCPRASATLGEAKFAEPDAVIPPRIPRAGLNFQRSTLNAQPSAMQNDPSLDSIMQTGLGFWASKTLLSAVELGVFTELARGALDTKTLRQRLGLHPRSARDFFDALVAMKFLERREGKYSNTPDTEFFLDRNKPTYAGGLLEMCNARLYGFWGSFTEGLRTGRAQNESKTGGDLFGSLYSTPEKLDWMKGKKFR
jgi:hypothetical protein